MTEIVWKDWKHQQVKPWQGCLLSLNLNPSGDWLSGRQSTVAPNAVRINPKRFPSNELYLEFERRQKLILDNKDRINSEDIFDFSSRLEWKVKTPVFAKLICELGLDMPTELAAFAAPSPPSQSKVKWPWGSYENEALRVTDAAVRKWWLNYDPADYTSAPTITVVSNWIQQEFGLTKNKATEIARLINADDLKSGPR